MSGVSHSAEDLLQRPVTAGRRQRCYDIIFRSDPGLGRLFDVLLFWLIIGSVVAVSLESVKSIDSRHGGLLYVIEWGFTLVFTVEYGLRLWCVRNSWHYARSFFGVVDLLSLLPTWLGLILLLDPSQQAHLESLLVIRALRLLRVFRVLKMGRYVRESSILTQALRASRQKITVFLVTVVSLVVIIGAIMYLVEGRVAESGFTSIPQSMYWAIVTLTTVGYGDISPQTVLGQFLASIVMVLGYGIIAVPTGIVSVELAEAARGQGGRRQLGCTACGATGHSSDALFCRRCGEELEPSRLDPA